MGEGSAHGVGFVKSGRGEGGVGGQGTLEPIPHELYLQMLTMAAELAQLITYTVMFASKYPNLHWESCTFS